MTSGSTPTASSLPSGGSILREYDDRHNLTRLTDLSGGMTTYEYDENSNLIAEPPPTVPSPAMSTTRRAASSPRPMPWATSPKSPPPARPSPCTPTMLPVACLPPPTRKAA
ncbi:MAG: hypothetical protein IKC28_01710 [Clostridia bacterium]|nr:hypothetical protein [Clostridia bacterium]